MSELIQNEHPRLEHLIAFSKRLIDGENGKQLIEAYKPFIDSINAAEAMQVFDSLLQAGYSIDLVKSFAGKLVNVFYKSLNSFEIHPPHELCSEFFLI